MAVADVGTTREAVIGDKLVVVGEGPDRLEPELGGFNGDVGGADGSVGGADGSVEGVAIVGVAEVCVGILELRLRVCITAGAVSLQTGKLPGSRLELVVVAMIEDSTRKRLGSLLDM